MNNTEGRSGRASSPANVQDGIALLGRLLVVFLFLPAGIGKLTSFTATTAYIASAGLPLPALGAAIAILVEVGFSMALLLGYRVRWVALGMALFTLAAAIFFHDFWALPEAQKLLMKTQFGKNMAIAGGLLAFTAFGGGRLSLDHRSTQPGAAARAQET